MTIKIHKFTDIQPQSTVFVDQVLGQISAELTSILHNNSRLNNKLALSISNLALKNKQQLDNTIRLLIVNSIKKFNVQTFVNDYSQFLGNVIKIRNLHCIDLKKLFFKHLDPEEVVDAILTLPRNENLYPFIKILYDQGLYFSHLEEKLIRASADFYSSKAGVVINSNEDYLDFLKLNLDHELMNCVYFDLEISQGFIPHESKCKLMVELHRVLVHDHSIAILDKYFVSAIKAKDYEILRSIYNLFITSHDLDALRASFASYILSTGTSIVQNESKDSKMIEELLVLMEDFKLCVCEFDNNIVFSEALREQFAIFLNKRQNKPAELIALYIDKLLKDSKKSESAVENLLDRCLLLFRLVEGKDIFEAFYGKSMAKRLLLSKSASTDAEKSMIMKLQTECGGGFTSKLEGMFKDVETSKDVMSSYLESKHCNSDIDFNVSVLTFGYWPSYPTLDLALPHLLTDQQSHFNDFYVAQHQGRKLTWITSLGHCLLHYTHPLGDKDLVLSLHQTLVFLLFNKSNSLTTREIMESTLLPPEELSRTLQSISVSKTRILKKVPLCKEIKDDDVFTLDKGFSHPQRRITVNSIQALQTPKESEDTTARVHEDRVYLLDCCIVRIMKSDRRITFKELVMKCFEGLRFPVEVDVLKVRVESLIDREYVERDANDINTLIYMA